MTKTNLVFSSFICAVLVSGGMARAQTVDLSLDVYYSNPANTNSSGTWQLVALASHRGLAALDVAISGVNPGPTFEAPRGLSEEGFKQAFNGGATPFDVDQDANAATLDMLFAQVPTSSPQLQDLFYDVGVPGGATQPGENGTPLIAGLVSGGNIPWNFSDILGDLLDDNIVNNSGAFEGGVLMASGTFNANSSFSILTTGNLSGANVFTSIGAANVPGTQAGAILSTQIRDNTYLAVPEPSALVLAGLAGALVGLGRKRRRA